MLAEGIKEIKDKGPRQVHTSTLAVYLNVTIIDG